MPPSKENQCGIIDSDLMANMVMINSAETVKNTRKLREEDQKKTRRRPEEDQKKLKEAKYDEMRFLLNEENPVVKPIPIEDVSQELQILKWALQIKRNSIPKSVRHRARLVSASNLSEFCDCITGNAPTIYLSTLRIVALALAVWRLKLEKKNDKLKIN